MIMFRMSYDLTSSPGKDRIYLEKRLETGMGNELLSG